MRGILFITSPAAAPPISLSLIFYLSLCIESTRPIFLVRCFGSRRSKQRNWNPLILSLRAYPPFSFSFSSDPLAAVVAQQWCSAKRAMARNNLGRLFSAISHLSTRNLVFPCARSGPLTLSSSDSVSRFVSSTTQHQQESSKYQPKEESIKGNNQNENNQKDQEDEESEDDDIVNKKTGEVGGPRGPEPTRYGDWERNGRCSDF
ncbi:DUF1674 domain-containing protein [Cephalotus follicularis]|uniref:Succinate dehydrogenase assembly factor 4, mitochondrial n=1 Tax=Cephalotus follicularis TaxID=3775 RepID=A0A1Q3BEG0_CEPFO|nr:DUF1674 domain-containing protein [Cephalotus follicularis]